MADKLKCTDCKEPLSFFIGYDGCDYDSVAGEGSGFNCCIFLRCTNCGKVYTLGRVKDFSEFSESVEKYRPYES